ncbi:MAG: diadenylate cyclase CdaA [Bacteroidales bacterium]|nr:diadenylate cyclase CdaA [Bacteroidales bacterium]MBN2756261.1 diadenylate cyclase CdaA [Bacteroidales bacterium]
MSFLNFGIIDFIDILLVAFLLYKLYNLLKGTVAINIFAGIFALYLIWLLVKALNMSLLSTILGQFMGVGVIAIIIVFQQEIRRFFLIIGSDYLSNLNLSIENIFSKILKEEPKVKVYSIAIACINLSKSKTGALIIVSDTSKLDNYAETGTILNAETSSSLLESIFFKNTPLHDGAVIIFKDKIYAAACILPVSDDKNLDPRYGLRHRSALGISESANTFSIVVSEETGEISYIKSGKFHSDVKGSELRKVLEYEFIKKDKNNSENIDLFRKLDLNPFKN